jgi:hypothetical protein
MPFLLLTFGVLALYAGHRALCWMERRGWIYYRRRRGASAALGNALLQVQTFYQPSVEQVLEARLEEPTEAAESGDPPSDEDDDEPEARPSR